MTFINSNFVSDLRKGFFLYFFYALIICFALNLRVDFSLHDLHDGIGESALRNFDAGLRVRMFYITLALLVAIIFFLVRLRAKASSWMNDYWLSVLNYTSLGALFILYSYIQDPELFQKLKTIHSIPDLFFGFPSITFFILIHICIFIFILFLRFVSHYLFFKNLRLSLSHFLTFPPFFTIHRFTLFILIPILFFILNYQPLCRDLHNLFELGNPALSIQQFFEFGKIPILESFNSHLLSEILPGFLYTWLHGYSGDLSFLQYDFIVIALTSLLGFYVIYLLTENVWVSLFIFIVLPVGGLIFHPFFSLAPLPALIFVLLIRTNRLLFYYLWIITIAFNFFWRVDIGLSSFMGSLGVALFFYSGNLKDFIKKMIKPWVLVFISTLILFLTLSFLRKINPVESFTNIFLHLSGATIFGTKALSIEYNALFFTHYLVFPVGVLLIIGWLIFNRKIFLETDNPQQTKIILLFYFCIYYLSNFHRGLIRHTFAEQDDLHVSTFIFFILPSCLFLLQPLILNKTKTSLLFLLLATLFCFQLKHPVEKNSNIKIPFDSFIQRNTGNETKPKEVSMTLNQITIPLEFLDEKFGQIKLFLNDFLRGGETFLDFSNTPMLYFYCHKRNPSFFNQMPNHVQTKNLQKRFLHTIKNDKIPVVIFSRDYDSGYDSQDEVPNTVRAYTLAAYIYRSYFPAMILNDYCIWIDKNFQPRLDSLNTFKQKFVPDTISLMPQKYDLKFIPYTLGKLDLDFIDRKFKPLITLDIPINTLHAGTEYKWQFHIEDTPNNTEFLWLGLLNQGDEKAEATISFGNNKDSVNKEWLGQFEFIIPERKDNNQYIIPLNSQYLWIKNRADYLRLNVRRGEVKVVRVVLCKWR